MPAGAMGDTQRQGNRRRTHQCQKSTTRRHHKPPYWFRIETRIGPAPKQSWALANDDVGLHLNVLAGIFASSVFVIVFGPMFEPDTPGIQTGVRPLESKARKALEQTAGSGNSPTVLPG
jgi:hypothetical protein